MVSVKLHCWCKGSHDGRRDEAGDALTLTGTTRNAVASARIAVQGDIPPGFTSTRPGKLPATGFNVTIEYPNGRMRTVREYT
jgi:hypothetical protein